MTAAAILLVWLFAGLPTCWAEPGKFGYKQPEPGSSPTMPSGGQSGGQSSAPTPMGATGGTGVQLGNIIDEAQNDSKGGSWRSDAYYREQARKNAAAKQDPAGPQAAEQPAPEEAPASPSVMSPADVLFNFSALVEAFVRKNSTDGYWEVADPKTGKTLRLKSKSIDQASLTGAKGKPLLTGLVLMRAAGRPRPVPVYFTVDLSGDDWKVVKYDLAKPARAR